MDKEKKKSLLLAVFSPTLLRIMHLPSITSNKEKKEVSLN